MKVAYLALSESLESRHAGAVHIKKISSALSKKANLRLFVREKDESKNEVGEVIEVKFKIVDFVNPFNFIKTFNFLKGKLKDFDLIHERYSVNPLTLLVIPKNKPYILEMNDPGVFTWNGVKRLIYAPLIKAKMKRADIIIVQTETLKKLIRFQLKNLNTEKQVYVVSNAAGLKDFNINKKQIMIKRRQLTDANKKIVCFSGSFREWHGISLIPEIAKKVLTKSPDTIFLMVGAGKEFNEFKKKIKELKIEKNFILTGKVKYNKVPLLLKASDILIAPFNMKQFNSTEKDFWWSPLKLFEYLASGKPVVATDYKEVRNILDNAALFIKENDIQSFSDAILKLLNDKQLSKKLSMNALKKAKHYDWNLKAEQLIKIYMGLIE